jgi:hypothetical protein
MLKNACKYWPNCEKWLQDNLAGIYAHNLQEPTYFGRFLALKLTHPSLLSKSEEQEMVIIEMKQKVG